MSYYKKPEEICTCGTGIDYWCAAHENEKPKKRFPFGKAILIVLFFALLILGVLYGGFDPLSFPGESGY